MHRRLRISIAPVLIASLALASCSSDGDGGDGGGGGDGSPSIESMLGEMPASTNTEPTNVMIVAGDVDRAAEAAGFTPFEPDTTTDELLENVSLLTGVSRDGEPAKVNLLLPEAVAPQYLSENDEIRDELGWSIVNVNSFIEIQSAPYRFAVLHADVSADDIDDAAGPSDDGIWSLGGEDLEQNLEDVSPVRRIGESLRMALRDDLLVVSRSTPPVREWLDGADETLADDDTLSSIASALDDADVYSALLVANDFSVVAALGGRGTPDQIEEILEGTELIDPFDALGAGLSLVDDEAVGTLVYHYASDDDAESAVDTIRSVFEDGSSIVSNQPISDLFDLRDVQADGDVVVATFGFPNGNPGAIWTMVFQRDLPTAHS